MVVKDGADGALRVDPDGSVLREAGRAAVPVDTTGAGDTFDAAYVDSFLRDLDPEECLRRACVAGALSTSAVGGTSAQPTLEQLSPGRDRSMHVIGEIESQPDAWRRAVAILPAVASALPQTGERVAVIGCGTSWFMAEAYAALREDSGLGETDCFPASRLPAGRDYDRVVAISRSGTTTEVLEALANTRARRTAITTAVSLPISQVSDETVVLDFADEESVVQTVFATTTLMLLRASLGEDLGPVVAQAEQVLRSPAGEGVPRGGQYTFLGQGWAHGIAREAALKMREAAQLWTESYPQMEYRHGPIAIAEPGRVVWVFGEPVPGLLDDVAATGATVVSDPLDPVADLVRAQRLAVLLAERLGLDPDRPRHLTRSVVLGA